MNQQDITDFLSGLGGVKVYVANQASGDPEVAWGDSFFYIINSAGHSPKMPFATIVTKDYAGFDEASSLNRGGLFRLNMDLGKAHFKELFGYLPAEHPAHQDQFDYKAINVVFPHPAYAGYGWASIINPAGSSEVQVKQSLVKAHQRVLRKFAV